MTLAFYLDEDAMRNSLLRALRSRGLDVVSAFEVGLAGDLDELQLAFAAQHARVLYSFNVAHFCRIHAEWLLDGKTHSGIVLARQVERHSVGVQLRGLLRLASQSNPAQMADRLEFLNNWI
ncbi:MAG: DUF5615 family PIN-like protein [Pirellulales bacterium]|nr:DUF5615 family PIN-like protein [Pirellulales bacterium]